MNDVPPAVTVFIPTWFAGTQLRTVLSAVFRQDTSFDYEVLIYDTTSTDVTPANIVEYAAAHANLRHKTITKAEFSHGGTRSAAAHDAHGQIVAYLTQDAEPADEHWLANLVSPILEGVADAVVGRQIPRASAPPILKYDIADTFARLGSDAGLTLYSTRDANLTPQQQGVAAFFSDVNSAIRRDLLVGTVPFRDVPYAEDQLFARDLLAAGFTKAYSPRGAVLHTNEVSFAEFKKRIFDETVGLRRVGIEVHAPSRLGSLGRVVFTALHQTPRILRDRQYPIPQRLFWIVTNPWLQWQKALGIRLGALVKLDDAQAIRLNSLEAGRTRQYGQETRPSQSAKAA